MESEKNIGGIGRRQNGKFLEKDKGNSARNGVGFGENMMVMAMQFNINVSDCCMVECMEPLANAVLESTAQQCTYLFMDRYGEGDPYGGLGGIVGVAETSRNQDITVKDCRAQVTINGGKSAGGIIGKVQKDASASPTAAFLLG